jgi:transcriptional regulator with XRE-family HTH domain
MEHKRPIDPHIGQRLKEYREHRGMTVRQLAEAVHLSPAAIGDYEHARTRIAADRIAHIARILKIKPSDLYEPPGSALRRNHVRSPPCT